MWFCVQQVAQPVPGGQQGSLRGSEGFVAREGVQPRHGEVETRAYTERGARYVMRLTVLGGSDRTLAVAG